MESKSLGMWPTTTEIHTAIVSKCRAEFKRRRDIIIQMEREERARKREELMKSITQELNGTSGGRRSCRNDGIIDLALGMALCAVFHHHFVVSGGH